MKKLKILFITQWLEMYGATQAVANLMMSLKKRYDIEAFVVIPRQEISYNLQTIDEVLDLENIPYYKIDMETWRTTFPNQDQIHILYYKVRKLFRNYKFIHEYQKNISFDPDVIYSNSSVIDVGIWLATKLKKPHVWHVREGEDSYHLKYIYPMWAVRRIFEKSEKVIAVSKYIQEDCQSQGIKCDCQIYDGVKVCPPYEKKYCESGIINFAVVGNFIKIKRQMDVIKAAKIIKEKGHFNYRVFLLGDGSERGKLEEKVQALGLEENIVFCGFVRDVQSALKKMDVGITATAYEAFGLATVEFMMNYMPVIGNDSGATPELIEEKGCGLVYHLGDINELAGCMEKFIVGAVDIVHLGIRARQEAEQYTIEKNADQIYDEIKKIIR